MKITICKPQKAPKKRKHISSYGVFDPITGRSLINGTVGYRMAYIIALKTGGEVYRHNGRKATKADMDAAIEGGAV